MPEVYTFLMVMLVIVLLDATGGFLLWHIDSPQVAASERRETVPQRSLSCSSVGHQSDTLSSKRNNTDVYSVATGLFVPVQDPRKRKVIHHEKRKIVLANAFALTAALLWVICTIFPAFALTVTSWWMHGLAFSAMGTWNLTWGNAFLGGVTLVMGAGLSAYLFGWRWETVNGDGRDEAGDAVRT